jgi:hypothetical protein
VFSTGEKWWKILDAAKCCTEGPMAGRFVGYVPVDGQRQLTSVDEAVEREWAEPTEVHPRWHRRWAEQGLRQEPIKTSAPATETSGTATANKPFAGIHSTTKGIAKVLLAMDMLDMGWKEAEPKLLDAGVVTNHSTFDRGRKRARKIASDRLRSSQP